MDHPANPDLANANLHFSPRQEVGVQEPPAARRRRRQQNVKDLAVAAATVGGLLALRFGADFAKARAREAARRRALRVALYFARRAAKKRIDAMDLSKLGFRPGS